MCEPYHSIVQYPDDYDDSDLPFGGNMDKESRLKSALGKAFGWARKFGKWFHLSKFGAGHSKATMENHRNTLYLPPPVNYEGCWWDRTFHEDTGGFWKEEKYRSTPESAQAALEYHKASVMGNMSLFRRFLETSMRKSTHPSGAYAYVSMLLDQVFNAKGRDEFFHKFHRVFGRKQEFQVFKPMTLWGQPHPSQNAHDLERGIKLVMGLTRKRGLFLPHFADDDSLWLPGGKG